ncbi:alpha/beta fold hydrolase [Paenibacillus dendritiformis]|uniref:alpha/beta fold hydrolase n=1 Tax=Paenibacillus dendritiformis TaxID=130049 RepID=UPI0002DB4EAD|nr:alpha/beta hydrolase [Paenibacillus dendritiformis]CAH8769546.1 alpha/beta hydrolase [Paenibacillus dendritiformis]
MKNRLNREIFFTEYVSINGIDQFLFHSGTSCENPVMLFLHGGPGAAKSLFTRVFKEKWEEIYTVVHWDQRGTGKTLTRNPDKTSYHRFDASGCMRGYPLFKGKIQ